LIFVFFYNMQENLQAFIYEKKNQRNPKNYLSVTVLVKYWNTHCIGKNTAILSNFSENYENATGGACGTLAATVGGEEILANRWSILVDLMSRILMVVILMVVDGWWARIDDLKLRWQPTIAALFRLNGAAKTLKPAGFLLYMRITTFLWWFGSLRWPEMGDRRRERESPARGERCSGLYHGVNASTVHRCSWGLWSVGSLMERSCGCDWLDLQVDRTVRMSRFVIWCYAVYRELGTPGDVAQRDQILEYFKGWDVSGYIWYFSNCFFFKNNILLSWKKTKKIKSVLSLLFFPSFLLPLLSWLFIANEQGTTHIHLPSTLNKKLY